VRPAIVAIVVSCALALPCLPLSAQQPEAPQGLEPPRLIEFVEADYPQAALADALAAKPHLAAYVSAPVKGQLVAGDIWMAQLWNGDTRQAQLENPQIAFALPEEGSLIYTDYMVIPRTAPHPHSAYAFLEYILRPEVAAGISEATGYGSPNRAAIGRMRDPIPYPSAEQLGRLEYQTDLGPATAVWDRVWTEVKSG